VNLLPTVLVLSALAVGAILRYRFLLRKGAAAAAETARVNAALQAEIEERERVEEDRDRFFDLSMDLLAIAGTDGYFKQLNPAWEKALGWTRTELMARPYADLVHPDDLEATAREAQRLRLGADTVDFENRFRRKDGTWRWLSWRSTAQPDRGLIYAVARDINDRKKIEQMKADFISVVSHELRTPLTALRGYAEALRDGAVSGPEVASTGAVLVRETERLDAFISDLLALARLEADDFPVAAVDLDPNDVVRDLVAAWQGRARGAEVRLSADVGSPLLAHVDPARLRQVLDGLVENAVRATPAGGHVEIRVEEDAEQVLVEVVDDGPGLDPGDHARAFERGYLRTRYAGGREVGTGLGLSIAARLSARAGMSLEAAPHPGGGTVFRLGLPRADADRRA